MTQVSSARVKKEILDVCGKENPTRVRKHLLTFLVEAEETDWRATLNKTAALTHPRVCRSVSRQKGRLHLTPPHPLRITHPSPQAPCASPPLFLVRKCHNSNVLTLGAWRKEPFDIVITEGSEFTVCGDEWLLRGTNGGAAVRGVARCWNSWEKQ